MGGPPGVLIVGGGLAGGWLALALRDLGVAVTLLDASPPLGGRAATAISYGALPGWALAPSPLARRAAQASRAWQQLQRRHGPLGWRPARLRLHGRSGLLQAASAMWPLPFAQVDAPLLMSRLPQLLQRAGVQLQRARVERLERRAAAGWQVQLSGGGLVEAEQVVLAAGAGCRSLWPDLPSRCRSTWAAVLELEAFPAPLGRPAAWLPASMERLALERRAATLREPAWVVDAGVVPTAARALLGQHTLLRPGLQVQAPPAALRVEQELRAALAAQPWSAGLAALPGSLQQAAVAFCLDGNPLVGAASAALPGLWLFTGFSAGFSQVPVLAPLLAARLAGRSPQAAAAEQTLRQWNVWPELRDRGDSPC